MIIQIVGTNGAGKSHLVRRLLDLARKRGSVEVESAPGRNRPLGYKLDLGLPRGIFVVGDYPDGVDSGGCDTISGKGYYEEIASLIETHASDTHVLFEGVRVMNHTRGPELVQRLGDEFHVLYLNMSFAFCLAAVNSRRTARGDKLLVNSRDVKGTWVRAHNYAMKMSEVGAEVHRVDREMGFQTLLRTLGVKDDY